MEKLWTLQEDSYFSKDSEKTPNASVTKKRGLKLAKRTIEEVIKWHEKMSLNGESLNDKVRDKLIHLALVNGTIGFIRLLAEDFCQRQLAGTLDDINFVELTKKATLRDQEWGDFIGFYDRACVKSSSMKAKKAKARNVKNWRQWA